MGDLFISITKRNHRTPNTLLDVHHCQGLTMMDICSYLCMGAVMERYKCECNSVLEEWNLPRYST
jgi:hypothetical protein